jgi:hypothetical protein
LRIEIFNSPFSSAKSHVKSQNPLTHYHTTTSALQISSTQTAILDIEIKEGTKALANSRGFALSERLLPSKPFVCNILDATPLLRIFYKD